MPQLKIGWAFRDVSTEKHVNIPGQFHARISEGILDPVTITALAVDNGEDSVVFLSCDQGSLRHHILEKVRILAKELDPSFPAGKLSFVKSIPYIRTKAVITFITTERQ